MKLQSLYYSKLYKKRETKNSNTNFFKDSINKISDEDKGKCEGNLTEYECGLSLKNMKNNISPGSDGITTEFYKIFWNDIKTYLIQSFNFSLQNGELTDLQKQGVITLLPKSGKNYFILDNWRPISLLNVDYKIATKAIADRLKQILPSIISSQQTGFIKGRYIGENVRLLFDILDYVNDQDLPSLLF